MEKLRVGWIGYGRRGAALLTPILNHMPDIEIVGMCDEYEDRVESGCARVCAARGVRPFDTVDYRDLLERDDVDAIVCASSWESHVDICRDSMLAGKPCGVEVGGAYSVNQCWELIDTYEKTGVPCMMLENCCYGKEEMTVLNMIKKGLFGEMVHCEGGYRHDLRESISTGHEMRHYRQRNYMHRNCDNYPTHELLPIMKNLEVNRGNRLVTLVSMSSKAAGMNSYIKRLKGEDYKNANFAFAQGDVVTTMIKCAHGETITLHLDTTLPRPYSRDGLAQGTLAIWSEEKNGVFFDGDEVVPSDNHKYLPFDSILEEHLHPLWRGYEAKGGHGGMDYLVLRAFFEAVMSGTDMPIDIYDTVTAMSITALTEESIAMGSSPVAIPDFTKGKWTHRKSAVRSKYCLDEVCEEFFE